MLNNIPLEMRERPQWIVWRLEYRVDATGAIDYDRKPTKVPYQPWPGGKKAASNRPEEWGTFEQASCAPLTSKEPADPNTSVEVTGFTGVGYMFHESDPYTGIDLDDTHGDVEAYQRQLKIFSEFNSYSELSPSGTGLHIIVKGNLPFGRRRACIELYSRERFFTMTGNVQLNVPIAECQELLQLLFDQMGGPAVTYEVKDKPQTEDDDVVITRAMNAANGTKFTELHNGNWQGMYPSQSEADIAYVDIVAFYTQNVAQIRRIFRESALGQTPKDNFEHRGDRAAYVDYMVNKSFDRQLPELDLDALTNLRNQFNAQVEAQLAAKAAGAMPAHTTPAANAPQEPGRTVDAHPLGASSTSGVVSANSFPPGLLGQIAQFILDAAPRPVPEIALAGAIAMLSGITGRAYNTYTGAGLNQYILLLAPTGTGKDAIIDGTSKLFNAIISQVPSAMDFKGPGELVSSAGLIKWIEKKPATFSILGEIGLLMQQMASPTANSHLKGLQRTLTQFYSRSGKGKTFDPSAYSDSQKNTGHILNPSLTIIGESVPGEFYAALDEGLIANGLLPRFTIFEYMGDRPYLHEGKEFVQPPFALVQQMADLSAQCLNLAHNGNVHIVPCTPEAYDKFREFDRWTTDQINSSGNQEVLRHLWNRAHLKALKMASVFAVGINYLNPIVDMAACMWATDLIVSQTIKLIHKFENDEIGDLNSSEAKQVHDVIKTIATFLHSPHDKYEKYGGTFDMHRDGVITSSHIQRRCVSMASFRADKFGATNAIKRAIAHLLDGDDIRELPKVQMGTKYGTPSRAFIVANPTRFLASVTDTK
jgi:hypothetical protein